MKKILLLSFLFLSFQNSYAINLKEAKELAGKNYPKLKAIEEKIKENALSIEKTQRERIGEIDITGTYASYNRNYMLIPMSHLPSPFNPPPFDSRKAIYGISVKVPLYLGGVISRKVEIGKVKQELLKNYLKGTRWQVELNAATVFLKALSLKERENALKEYLKSLKKLYESTRAGVEAGKLAEVDLLKVSYSIKEVKARIRKVKENYRALITALETLTGQKVSELQPPKIPYQPKKWKLEGLYRELLKNNSLLKTAEEKVRLTQTEKELVRAKYGVRVNLKGMLTRNYGFDSGKNEAYGYLGLNVSLPLFTGGRKGLELLEKESEVKQALYEKNEKEKELKRELAEVVATLNWIQERIEADSEKLRLAKEVERIEELKYISGKGDINHLLLAKAQRYQSQAELKSSYYDWLAALERLKALLEVKDEQ